MMQGTHCLCALQYGLGIMHGGLHAPTAMSGPPGADRSAIVPSLTQVPLVVVVAVTGLILQVWGVLFIGPLMISSSGKHPHQSGTSPCF